MKPDPQGRRPGRRQPALGWPKASPTPALSQEPASREQLQHRARRLPLRARNAERALCAWSQIKLEEARDRYIDLFESAPIGYLILNRDGGGHAVQSRRCGTALERAGAVE